MVKDIPENWEREISFFPVETQPKKLSQQQVEQYNEKGCLFPLDVFSEEEIGKHRAYLDVLMDKTVRAGHDAYAINSWHNLCPGIYDLATNDRILDYVQDILGENLICWASHYFCKMPGDTKRVSWHQDASYWPLTPTKAVTVWLAIDDVDEENGAMRVVPGSHLHGHISYQRSSADENNVLNQSVGNIDEYGDTPVSANLKAGQIELHSDLLLHGSEPNPSTRRRGGLTLRYVSPDVRFIESAGWVQNAIICRGGDPSGYWFQKPRPESDQIPSVGADRNLLNN